MSAVGEATQLTDQAAAQIRGLIIDRVLLPGEKIRQVELAETIGVSRSPLREALRTLEAEGVVAYHANRGYVVSRLDDEDLAQIHRMRSLLESELLRTVVKPTREQLAALKDINDRLADAVKAHEVAEIVRLNRLFHFSLFELSPLNLIRREVTRIWQLSDVYSAAWWWRTPAAGARIISEHKAILTALRKYDIDGLIDISERHRTGGYERAVSGTPNR
ncbi:GntR family transcriptional regulator [Dactylosporangium sp. NPDC051485]|uniref:GntR family transcriptional regulator n=1 Tax=Dactylosporangium sp. NPDC051485 TaxID=3154846 RepID=UPI003449651A